jgi:hypothetical protein
MAAETNTGDGLACYNFSHHKQHGDRFCERCGSRLEVVPAFRQPASRRWAGQLGAGWCYRPGPSPDGTTRYLCDA